MNVERTVVFVGVSSVLYTTHLKTFPIGNVYITFPVTFAFSGKKPSSTMHLFIKVVVSYNFLRFVVPKRKTEQIIECFFLVHTWLL